MSSVKVANWVFGGTFGQLLVKPHRISNSREPSVSRTSGSLKLEKKFEILGCFDPPHP